MQSGSSSCNRRNQGAAAEVGAIRDQHAACGRCWRAVALYRQLPGTHLTPPACCGIGIEGASPRVYLLSFTILMLHVA